MRAVRLNGPSRSLALAGRLARLRAFGPRFRRPARGSLAARRIDTQTTDRWKVVAASFVFPSRKGSPSTSPPWSCLASGPLFLRSITGEAVAIEPEWRRLRAKATHN